MEILSWNFEDDSLKKFYINGKLNFQILDEQDGKLI